MQVIYDAIIAFTGWLWGVPMLVFLVGGGLFLSVRTGFMQFTKLGYVLKNTIFKGFGKKVQGDNKFSSFQALTGALANTLGAGNIIGTAMAIAFGGPGAVFWLWMTGFFCCMVKYFETCMAMKYRHKDSKGQWIGGPQYYLSESTGWKWIGTLYSLLCICCLWLAASGQIGSGVDNLEVIGVPRMVSTFVLIALAALVVLGGMKGLLRMTEKMVPTMAIVYIVGCLAVIILNIGALPGVIVDIFRYAFTGHAAFGGFVGSTFALCLRWGVARGAYSNDAGTGVTTITHAVAECNHPVEQSMWTIFEVFFDTIIVCSLTCFTILVTGVWTSEGVLPAVMTATAFETTFGVFGKYLVAIVVVLFTFTTACAQTEFVAAQFSKLIGEKAMAIGRICGLGIMVIGGVVGLGALIDLIDFFCGLYIVVNMTVVYLHNSEVVELTKEYFANTKKWETEMWPKWKQLEAECEKSKK